jgi:hypothetical protein
MSLTGGSHTSHPLSCLCGKLRGHVDRPGMALRGRCYCKDCQAFARFLGRADSLLDEHAGTSIVAIRPSQLHFSQGLDALACMSLSERGLLRWYASCCNTPIGNTPRDPRTHYLGLVETCLAGGSPSIEQSFGPVRLVLNTKAAVGPVKATGVASKVVNLLRLMKSMAGARLGGAWKRNPLFDTATGTPVRQPRVLTGDERERLAHAA